MLKIRLARGGKHKAPFYRVVLTEHTKPAQSGYMKVLGWFDPLHHKTEMDIEAIKEWIGKGAQPSNRVAKLARKLSNDAFFDQYITVIERKRKKRDGSDDVEEEVVEETPAAPETPAAEAAPATEEAPKEEAPAAEEKQEEAQEEQTEEAAE